VQKSLKFQKHLANVIIFTIIIFHILQ